MTSTITPTRVKNRSDTSRRVHSSRPDSGRRSGRRTGGTSAASRRAYDRRRRRTGGGASAGVGNAASALRLAGPRELARRIPFVVFVMALFVAGMGITLWLTTSATARSYQIADAQQQNSRLEDQKESLEKIVQAGNSAPELARKAAELGMVQSEDVARLVVAPDGSVTVHGEPNPAEGPKPGDLARVPAAEDAIAPSAGAPSSGTPSPDGVLPPADAAPIPPADAEPAPPADADVMAAPADGATSAPPARDDTPPSAPAPGHDPADTAPAEAPPADAAPIPPADAEPVPPADAARGGDGPAGAPSEGAH